MRMTHLVVKFVCPSLCMLLQDQWIDANFDTSGNELEFSFAG